ncbi:MAG: outer membrane beta-barrel protein [Spongiibacteraceae bacterium]
MKKLLLITMTTFASANLLADGLTTNKSSGFYLGAGVGVVGYDDDNLSDDLGDDTGLYKAIDTDSDDTGLKILSGYQLNKLMAVELSYTDYGDTDYSAYSDTLFSLKIRTTSLAANIGYSFDSGWRPFALLGLSYVDVDADSPLSSSLSSSENYLGVHYGLGVEYSSPSMRHIAFRIAVEGDAFIDDSFEDLDRRYYEDEYLLSATILYAGVVFRF